MISFTIKTIMVLLLIILNLNDILYLAIIIEWFNNKFMVKRSGLI